MNKPKQPRVEAVAAEIIALESAALERWGHGDPSGFLELSAPDVVYFDPYLDRRIDGRDALARYYEGIRGKVSIARFELVNPAVQVIRDAAVLTFNYVSYGRDGEKHPWNCTEVYRRSGGTWQIVQTHWSCTGAGKA